MRHTGLVVGALMLAACAPGGVYMNDINATSTIAESNAASTGATGVGFARKPPVFLKEGDVCEVEVEGLGVLSNPVSSG